MTNKKGRLIYGIIGLGRFGSSLAYELSKSGEDLIILDENEDKVSFVREFTENAYVVKNLSKQTLIDTGLQNCDVVVVCIGEQIDTSVLTTLNLVSLGIPKVISKATSQEHGEVLEKLGAEVVYPERDMSIRLANRLETFSMLDFIKLSEKVSISKTIVPEIFIDKRIIDVNLRTQFGLNIIAIENKDIVIELIDPNYIFQKNDILYLAGGKKGFDKLVKKAM